MTSSLLVRVAGGLAMAIAAAFVGGCSGSGGAGAPALVAVPARAPQSTGSITVVYPANFMRAPSATGERAPRFLDPLGGASLSVSVSSGSYPYESASACYPVSPVNGKQTLLGVPIFAGSGAISVTEYSSGGAATPCTVSGSQLAATVNGVSYYNAVGGQDNASISISPIVLQPMASAIQYSFSANGPFNPIPAATTIPLAPTGVCTASPSPAPAPKIVYFQTVDAAGGYLGAGVIGGGFPSVTLQPGAAPTASASTPPTVVGGPAPGSISITLNGSADTVSIPIRGTDAFGAIINVTPKFGC